MSRMRIHYFASYSNKSHFQKHFYVSLLLLPAPLSLLLERCDLHACCVCVISPHPKVFFCIPTGSRLILVTLCRGAPLKSILIRILCMSECPVPSILLSPSHIHVARSPSAVLRQPQRTLPPPALVLLQAPGELPWASFPLPLASSLRPHVLLSFERSFSSLPTIIPLPLSDPGFIYLNFFFSLFKRFLKNVYCTFVGVHMYMETNRRTP